MVDAAISPLLSSVVEPRGRRNRTSAARVSAGCHRGVTPLRRRVGHWSAVQRVQAKDSEGAQLQSVAVGV